MGRLFIRRSIALAAVVGMSGAGVVAPTDAVIYRAASTDRIEDAVGETGGRRSLPHDEPRADLTGAQASVHSDGRLELSATVPQGTNPATDPNWAGDWSWIIWTIDADGNSEPNYFVYLGVETEMTALVLTAEESSPTPGSGCQPLAGFAAGRYSVTLGPSCLSLPASFGWGVGILYDADHADRETGATDSAPDGNGMVAGPGMAVGPGMIADPTGDVTVERVTYDPRADITSATIAYDPGRITVTASVAQPTDPRVDPNWANGSSHVHWYFDTDGDNETDYAAVLGGNPDLSVTVYELNSNILIPVCTAMATLIPNGYSATLDPACIGSPDRMWWAVGTNYDVQGQKAVDQALILGLTGPVTAEADPQARPSGTGGHSGYWMMTDYGEVFAFGDARPLRTERGTTAKWVDIEPTRTGNGYWMLSATGEVFTKGDANNLGDPMFGQLAPGEKASAFSAAATGDGYWIFTDRGRVLPYGNAAHHGDMTGTLLNGPVLDSVATPSGQGYWMVGSDGGIFAFGDATFSGSTGDMRLNQPVMSMAADPDGTGYWLVASDGGIFAFDAPFYGSMGATRLNKPISGMVPGAAGYLMVGEDGGIFSFGDVAFHGSLGNKPPDRPVVAVALAPTGR